MKYQLVFSDSLKERQTRNITIFHTVLLCTTSTFYYHHYHFPSRYSYPQCFMQEALNPEWTTWWHCIFPSSWTLRNHFYWGLLCLKRLHQPLGSATYWRGDRDEVQTQPDGDWPRLGGLTAATRPRPSIRRGSCNVSSPVNKSAGLPSTAKCNW